ncbi:HNH endonuclease [Candidatus Burkholderia pumila]|uniref:HNH endonuclease n=1 Tax=Candidatus Burkholderia pumila TaxID=1090375 RepID=A0ABR5HMF0_9BURK|nr:HNH endonuclease [Candidatus Burkholderia pumila]
MSDSTFINYGVPSDLALSVQSRGLTVGRVRALSISELVEFYNLTEEQAQFLRQAVKRKAIDNLDIQLLLEPSNFICNACKDTESHAYVLHHIVPYEETQDNQYDNLIVLCASDHDLAYRGGLTLWLNERQLRRAKRSWEIQVAMANVERSAQTIAIDDNAIDYINLRRIEGLCIRVFCFIPETTCTSRLKRTGILDGDGAFDQKFVQSNMSGGRYLFDYVNHREGEHYI